MCVCVFVENHFPVSLESPEKVRPFKSHAIQKRNKHTVLCDINYLFTLQKKDPIKTNKLTIGNITHT